MVDHADHALHDAKEGGRNRTVAYDPKRTSMPSALMPLSAAVGS